MPGWVILLVEFLLNVGGNVLFDVVLFKSLGERKVESASVSHFEKLVSSKFEILLH